LFNQTMTADAYFYPGWRQFHFMAMLLKS